MQIRNWMHPHVLIAQGGDAIQNLVFSDMKRLGRFVEVKNEVKKVNIDSYSVTDDTPTRAVLWISYP
jgi:hypothetical protein